MDTTVGKQAIAKEGVVDGLAAAGISYTIYLRATG
jgi:hypothetical protein